MLANPHIVVIEQLESGKLDRLSCDIGLVRGGLQGGRSEAVHVHHDLHFGQRFDGAEVRYHELSEAVDDEDFWGQLVCLHDLRQESRGKVYVGGIQSADTGPGRRAVGQSKLWIESKLDVRPFEVPRQA